MQDIPAILGADGPFAALIPGFAPRLQQQELAEAVAATLAGHEVFIAEAGTGTGKTFAYLVPALLSGQKVIISTGTKNLQDQLFHKDLPLVRKALAVSVDVALLKGRANYLCLHRMESALAEGRFRSRGEVAQLGVIERWSAQTRSGDIAELTELNEDAPLWSHVTSTADNCLGTECGRLDDCFLVKARRRAQEADVLVVNHHLLFADMALRDEGFGELLPGANAFILDEAHQLPETASNFFGISLGGNQLLELARDAIVEDLREAGESSGVRQAAERLEKAVREMRLAFGVEAHRGPWHEAGRLAAGVQGMGEMAEGMAERGAGRERGGGRGEGGGRASWQGRATGWGWGVNVVCAVGSAAVPARSGAAI